MDYKNAISLADHVSGNNEEAEALLKWLRLKAKSTVEFYWPAIKALAAELVNRQKISGKEARPIMGKAMGFHPVFRRY
jgi:hypothetical protein